MNGKVFLTLLISTVSSRLQLKHSNLHVSSISFLIWSSLNSIVKCWESKSACVIIVFGCLLNIEYWLHLLYTHTLNDKVLHTCTCLYCLIIMVNTVCWHLLIINNQAIVPLFTSYIAEKLFYLVQNLKTKIKTFFLQNNTNSDISDYFYFLSIKWHDGRCVARLFRGY